VGEVLALERELRELGAAGQVRSGG
jgi:hypothetical protein